jgi:hypothetical protein
MRRFLALPIAGLLLVALAAPAAAKDFGTIYIEGDAYRTFGNPATVPAGTGTDPIIAFTNFDQGGVARYAPGEGSHGGRWQVWMATWVDPSEATLQTDFDDVLALVESGDLTIMRAADADFRCPVLPARGTD